MLSYKLGKVTSSVRVYKIYEHDYATFKGDASANQDMCFASCDLWNEEEPIRHLVEAWSVQHVSTGDVSSL